MPRVTTSLTLLAIAATVAWNSVDSVHTDQVRHETVTGPWLPRSDTLPCRRLGDLEVDRSHVCEMIKHDQNMADIQRLIINEF